MLGQEEYINSILNKFKKHDSKKEEVKTTNNSQEDNNFMDVLAHIKMILR